MLIDGVSLETPIDYLAVTFIVSLVGFPVLTLPTPRRPDQKPFGVQIIAAPGEESKLFAFGRRIEEQLGFSSSSATHLIKRRDVQGGRRAGLRGRSTVWRRAGEMSQRSLFAAGARAGLRPVLQRPRPDRSQAPEFIGDPLGQSRQRRAGQNEHVGFILLHGALASSTRRSSF